MEALQAEGQQGKGPAVGGLWQVWDLKEGWVVAAVSQLPGWTRWGQGGGGQESDYVKFYISIFVFSELFLLLFI